MIITKKSDFDYKQYKIFTLNNDLKVIIISDIKNDNDEDKEDVIESAAALCVGVGSFEDPPELQGLAHYLEHMLFMGSEKYPTENDFDSAVSQYGGSSNAWTDAERTLYHFDCYKEHFVECLDKFANFFIGPLMLKDSMDREVTAVNSEFELTTSADSLRRFEILQTTSKDGSPFRIMNCGNTKTLKLDPYSQNIDVYERLQQFRKEKYSSHKMTLAVQSREPLNVIEEYVRRIFNDIPINKQPKQDMSIYQNSFDTPEFKRYYEVASIKNTMKVALTWEMPSTLPNYKNQVYRLMGHIFGNEGRGSLAHYLKDKNLANGLTAGNGGGGYDLTSFNSMFTISVNLTDLGANCIDKVVEIIFSFIKKVQRTEIPAFIYEEMQELSYMQLKFRDLSSPQSTVEQLAQNLQIYNAEDVISGELLLEKIDRQLVKSMIDLMTWDRMNVMASGKQYESTANLQTQWMTVKYSMRDFTEEERQKWSNPINIEDLSLPRPNQYIAKDFRVIPLPVDRSQQAHYPVNLSAIEFPEAAKYGHLWHCYDYKFREPKAYIHLNFRGNVNRKSPTDEVIFDIISYAVKLDLEVKLYEASDAMVYYDVFGNPNNLTVDVYGLSDKLPLVLSAIVDQFVHFQLDEHKYQIYLEYFKKIYFNRLIDPSKLAASVNYRIFNPDYTTDIELLKALQTINYDQVINYAKSMFHEVCINSLFYGNIDKETCAKCFMYAANQLQLQPNQVLFKHQIRKLTRPKSHIRVESFSRTDNNTSICYEYVIGPATIRLLALNKFLDHVLSENCFDYLRTKETLGYKVRLSSEQTRGILTVLITVGSESTKYSIDHCRQKMEFYFEQEALKFLNEMDEETYEDFVESFISSNLAEDVSINQAQKHHWAEIYRQEYLFDRRIQLAENIENTSKKQLIEFFQKYYLNSKFCRKFIVEVDSCADNSSLPENTADIELKYLPIDNANTNSDTIDEIVKSCEIDHYVHINDQQHRLL